MEGGGEGVEGGERKREKEFETCSNNVHRYVVKTLYISLFIHTHTLIHAYIYIPTNNTHIHIHIAFSINRLCIVKTTYLPKNVRRPSNSVFDETNQQKLAIESFD